MCAEIVIISVLKASYHHSTGEFYNLKKKLNSICVHNTEVVLRWQTDLWRWESTKAAPKVMPPILFCWPTISEADVGGTTAEAEPSHQYSIPFCRRVTDGSRGAAWQNGIWHGSVYDTKGCLCIPQCPLTFTDTCWTFMEIEQWMWTQWGGGWCISAVVTVTVDYLPWCRL